MICLAFFISEYLFLIFLNDLSKRFLAVSSFWQFDLPAVKPNCREEIRPEASDVQSIRDLMIFSKSFPITEGRQITFQEDSEGANLPSGRKDVPAKAPVEEPY